MKESSSPDEEPCGCCRFFMRVEKSLKSRIPFPMRSSLMLRTFLPMATTLLKSNKSSSSSSSSTPVRALVDLGAGGGRRGDEKERCVGGCWSGCCISIIELLRRCAGASCCLDFPESRDTKGSKDCLGWEEGMSLCVYH